MLIIMRGLPASGKSYRAKELKGENGVIFSTDDFFYKHVKPDKPDEYSFNPQFLGEAHKWNLRQAEKAIFSENPPNPIIIDNTNTQVWEPKKYVTLAHSMNLAIEIHEPTSDHWQKIKILLQDKRKNKEELKNWAKFLEDLSKKTHSVPFFAIEKMMWRWESYTVDDILNYEE